MNGDPLADVMTGADATCAAVFRTMLTVVARGASMAWKRTCARCTESGAGEQNGNEKNDGYFHVRIIITPPSAAQGVKIGLYLFVR
jgi:hypothetical protein